MTQDRETEGKKLEKLYDDDKITYAEFEEMTRGLILTPAQDVDRRKRQHWKNRGGWFGYFRRMLIGLIGWMIDCVAIAG